MSDEASYMSKIKRSDSARRSIMNAREVIRRSVSKTREKGMQEEPVISMPRIRNSSKRQYGHLGNGSGRPHRRDNSV